MAQQSSPSEFYRKPNEQHQSRPKSGGKQEPNADPPSYKRAQVDQDLAALVDELADSTYATDSAVFDPASADSMLTAPTLDETDLPDDLSMFSGSTPSLAIILLSAASAIAMFIIVLYVTYRELAFRIEFSAGIATFLASMTLGLTGAALSAITDSRAATSNIVFSCGLIAIALLFFGLCVFVGAVAALLLLFLTGA